MVTDWFARGRSSGGAGTTAEGAADGKHDKPVAEVAESNAPSTSPTATSGEHDGGTGAKKATGPGARLAGSDPVPLAITLAQQKAKLAAKYGGVFQQIGLSGEGRDHVLNLLVAQENAAADLAAAAATTHPELLDDERLFDAMYRSEKQTLEDQLQAALGPSGYAQLLAYNQSQAGSKLVAKVQDLLAGSPDALSETQITQLRAAMMDNNALGPTGKLVAGAQAFLNPNQMTALQRVRQSAINATQQRDARLGVAPKGP